MEDKLIKILGRYIEKNYPELLNGNLYFNDGGMSGSYSMGYNNCYIGSIVLYGGDMSSIFINDGYHSLRHIFGDEYKGLFLKWFNKEHEVMLYSLLGNDCGVLFLNDCGVYY